MTELTKRATPETDAEALRCSGNTDDDDEGQAVVGIRFARSLEQRLGAVTEALEFYAFAPGTMEVLKDAGLKARETLAAIKAKP